MGKKIFIIDGPSGCGKTTVSLELEKLSDDIKYICSCTKRNKRPEEVDGKEHFFLSDLEFENKKNNNKLLGYYKMYFNEYGIDRDKILYSDQNNIIITYHSEEGTIKNDIKNIGLNLTTILILPDNENILRERIVGRDQAIKEKEIEARLKKYKEILSYKDKYNYVFINKQGFLEKLVNDIYNVILLNNKNNG